VKISRLLSGVVLGLALMGGVWYGGWVPPPEGLSRRMAVFHATFPGALRDAEVERIDCPPLRRLRLYVVCTRGCEGVWRLVLVKGLRATTLANLSGSPPEPSSITRQRMNAAVGREALRLTPTQAREMIACYLRLDGLYPELVLPEGGLEAVEEARRLGEAAMQSLEERLNDQAASGRIAIEEVAQGYEADMLYWDTRREGSPVLRLRLDLARDGQMRGARAWLMPEATRPPPEGEGSE
jgi:hypothetical protein